MKKTLVALTALLAIVAIPAFAGDNYHYNANMNCSDCHSMHASAHNNLTDGSAITTPSGVVPSTDINPYYPDPANAANGAYAPGHHSLLKGEDVCATCHDGQDWAPDVIGDNDNGYARSAGGVREGVVGGGHKIGSTVRPPGYNSAALGADLYPAGSTLECASCHSPHGGTSYRNLVGYAWKGPLGANASKITPTVAKGAFDATKDVTILGADTYVFGTSDMADYYGKDKTVYSRAETPIIFNAGSSSNRMDQFCGVCHGAFHGGIATDGSVGDNTDFVRHPTSVVTMADAAHGSPNTTFTSKFGDKNLKVYQVAATPSNVTDSPGCVSCHKAHGSNNPFGLIYPNRTAIDATEDGTGTFKDLCKSCHSMGGV
jgi:hypothetical protein